MPWDNVTGLTGSGNVTLDPTWTGLLRVHITSFGKLQPWGPIAASQLWQQLGWVAVYDDDETLPSPPIPDGPWLGSTAWLNFEYHEFDFTEFVTAINGATGIAYALFGGVTIDVHAFTP